VEVRALSFRYPTPAGPGAAPGPERVLDDVSFSAAPRSVTAVVGGRRAGKSTLAHLLQHLYEPAAGAVLLDGVDVRALDTDWLRENVTVVHEDPVLFNMSLAQAPPPPLPLSRTDWTRLVPPPVLTGHVSSLLPY
jgi:ATP-binding cassette subfamily B (MDR/TAP) protein 1